jgi:peptidoglycan/xylan/chitin deacetylase (PgdA/CDA1 family)
MHNVLILNYHSIDVGKQSEEYHVDPVYSVKQQDFEQQLELIKKLKIPVVSLDELVKDVKACHRWHRHQVVVTFDDGFLTDYEVAFPLLKKYNFPATFFITLQNQRSPERWAQWREMAAAGFTLGSHTVSHPMLTEIPVAEMEMELAESKQVIEQETGTTVKYLAPPNGRFNSQVLATKVGVNRFNADLFQLKRWTIRRNTTLKEFERMLLRDKRELKAKEMRSQVLNVSKKLLGNGPFEKIRKLILRPKK